MLSMCQTFSKMFYRLYLHNNFTASYKFVIKEVMQLFPNSQMANWKINTQIRFSNFNPNFHSIYQNWLLFS